MCASVLLPAPFSPRSACTSPAAASKSTPSFATTPGKRLVNPRTAMAGGGQPEPSPAPGSGGKSSNDALHEPVHGVEILDVQPGALRDLELPLLVVERPRELVELPAHDLGLFLEDRGSHRRAHLGPERRQPDQPVLDRAVVEARLPRAVPRRRDPPQVVRP